jgi:hypothetical protein
VTVMTFRLSPRAVSAIGSRMDATGMGLDEVAEELILQAAGREPGDRVVIPGLDEVSGDKRRFLELLSEEGSVSGACEGICIAQGTPYAWARTDAVFAQLFDSIRGDLRASRRDSLKAMGM